MKLGTNDIGSVYLGTNAVQKVYLGTNEVWSSFTGLLDDYPNAAAAYSLRKLRSAYSGSAIRVRRASDNTEQDIGFVNNELDTSTLTSFCSGTNGFVKTWYDQSGNGRDATQSTASAQPQIVSSGSVILENGKPSVQFDGTNDVLTASTATDWNFLHQAGSYTNFGVARCGNTADPNNAQTIWGNTNTAGFDGAFFSYDDRTIVPFNNALRHLISNGSPSNNLAVLNSVDNYQSANVQFLHTVIGNPDNATVVDRSKIASNGGIFQQNGFSTGNVSSAAADKPLSIGSAVNISNVFVNFLQGTTQEQIFYASDQSSNRTGIETNINSHYNIY